MHSFFKVGIGSHMQSIEGWDCLWPWVTRNHPTIYILRCFSYLRSGWM